VQLPLFAVEITFSILPNDVFLIGKKYFRHMGHVDLLIVGWYCQGQSNPIQFNPQSNLSWKLV
jgi:hypothetical protein